MPFGWPRKRKTPKLKSFPRDEEFFNMPLVEGRLVYATVSEPFINWAMTCMEPCPREDVLNFFGDGKGFIVDADEDEVDTNEIIDRNAVKILELTLWSWCRDPGLWPKNITPKLAREWLDLRHVEMVYDLAEAEMLNRELGYLEDD